MTFIKVKGHQRSILAIMTFKFCQMYKYLKLGRIMYLKEVKCQQMFKVATYALTLRMKHHQTIQKVRTLQRVFPHNFARVLAKGTLMSCF